MSSADATASDFPRFIIKNEEGIHVDLSKLESSTLFYSFVDHAFASGTYFTDLDYKQFIDLLYNHTPETFAAESAENTESHTVRFASDIAAFPPERRALYTGPFLIKGKAEYIFSPVTLNGEATKLSLDEFIAAMWTMGVRYGIDAPTIQVVIGKGKSERIVFARPLEPTAGKDAQIEEQINGLYRDDAPKTLSNGKIDLNQFSNRFPQVSKGTRILKKIPRVLGDPGRAIDGKVIEPPIPQNIDLHALSGAGTFIESTPEGDFITSGVNGFLSIDTHTNKIDIQEKIVNRSGVSVKTTGNISINCEEYEEHGEIQEKRILEGRNITVFSDVFGTVISLGGKILLKKALISGSATNHDGDITVDGLVSRAIVQAVNGEIKLKNVENSIIIGRNVSLETAINCDIFCDTLHMGVSEGCDIAAKSAHIGEAGPRKDHDTTLIMLIPDLSNFNQVIGEIRKKIEDIDTELARKQKESKEISERTDIKNYITLVANIRRTNMVLTDAQKVNLQTMALQVGPSMKKLTKLREEIQALQKQKETLSEKISTALTAQQDASTGIICEIERPKGDTHVNMLQISLSENPLATIEPKKLKSWLGEHKTSTSRIPCRRGEKLHWQFEVKK